MNLMRAAIGLLPLFLAVSSGSAPARAEYQSPYEVTFKVPLEELHAVDRKYPRNNANLESTTPYRDWYSRSVRRIYGAWGPAPRHYPALEGFENIPADWKRQRVLAVALSLIGLPYQHHHIPDWDPPRSWPWIPVAYGKNSIGMDCSDFTSWIYNYGMGIHMTSDVAKQAERTHIVGPGGQGSVEAKVIRDTNGYDDLVSKLQTGDLLYIKHKGANNVSHVVMWVGEYGHSPDKTPLVIDCTGPDHQDSNGNAIPIGVHLRPFGKHSWYYESFSHAHRIIGEPLQ